MILTVNVSARTNSGVLKSEKEMTVTVPDKVAPALQFYNLEHFIALMIADAQTEYFENVSAKEDK